MRLHILTRTFIIKNAADAPETAKKQLEKCGPLTRSEKITAGAFAITVALWIGGGAIGVNAVAAATVGLAIMLITNVVTWKVRSKPCD
jgi:di/tricarboxylate transporter